MKSTLHVKISLFTAAIVVSQNGSAGVIGGGGPPSVHVENQQLMEMQEASLKDQIFRVTRPGAEPVYMVPGKQSMSARRLSAFSVGTNEETIFFAKSDAEKIQEAFGTSVTRTMSTTLPGLLSIKPGDLALDLPAKVEVVPASEIQNK
ncbi:MAG: hypothetical protein M3Q07_09320 [Pseudobdellovibrionaceae bacterium]|nr:hypothetical protein [Pseudobdellovibrionaceae bacterium]